MSTPLADGPAPAADPGLPSGGTPDPGRSGAVPVLLWAGILLLVVGSLLSWTGAPDILGNLTLTLSPAPLQYFALGLAALAVFFLVVRTGPLAVVGRYLDTRRALLVVGIGSVVLVVLVLVSIAVQAGGLVNVNPGGWVTLAGAGLLAAGAVVARPVAVRDILRAKAPSVLELLAIIALLATALFAAAFALGQEDATVFVGFLVVVATAAVALARAGVFSWVGLLAQKHRQVLMLGAFTVAFLFPFTQGGSDANMSIASQVLVFAATAIGLNIVVGLAGLLDLGYIAFLGAGAYVGAVLSQSAFATISWKPPFLLVVVIGALFTSVLGLIIGSPTLRVSGDYLAIVTLAFGEIFRLTVNNLDGNNGPDLTNGPNGIPAIPDLEVGAFNFGDTHEVFGVTLGRFANYYLLLLFVAAFIILVFTRLNNSRIGRGWVAIREDERAAEAMGVNVYGLKIFAFAGGAFLAGLAGTIKAHQDVSVTPDQYIFLESAFLLAAVVLGGMGTVAGVLVGATILKLLPEKLRFVAEFRLLLFGLLLVLMMRFRPEGLVPSRRRQLEFHESDEALAEQIEEVHLERKEATT